MLGAQNDHQRPVDALARDEREHWEEIVYRTAYHEGYESGLEAGLKLFLPGWYPSDWTHGSQLPTAVCYAALWKATNCAKRPHELWPREDRIQSACSVLYPEVGP